MSTLRKKYKSIINALPDMVFVINRDGRYLDFINSASHTGTIYPDNVKFKKLPDIMPGPLADEIMHCILAVLETRQTSHHSYQLIINNEARNYEARYVPYRKNKVLAFVRDVTERKKVENELMKSREELRQLNNHIGNIREEERLNIAREIHDELGQQLTVFKIHISRLGKKANPSEDISAADIKEMLDLIDRMVETVRKISTELRPGMLDDLGLVAAMDWYSRDFGKTTGITTSFISNIKNDKIPELLNIGAFRIFQESLTNVARHSEATKVDISLMLQDRQLVLLIEDNGKGFDPSLIQSKKALSLLWMKERAIMMNGTYILYSSPGKGTITEVILPLSGPA